MIKKDFFIVAVIGALVGVLVQPMISTLGGSLAKAGIHPTAGLRIGIFIFLLILAPTALLLFYLLGKIWGVFYQFAKFAAVGVLNTVIDFGVLNLLIFLSGAASGWLYSLFKAISFLTATTNSFFWNKHWTFDYQKKATVGQAASFYVIASVAWAANVLIASFVVNFLARPASISPNLWANIGALAGVAGSFLIDFLGYKYLVFGKK